MQFKLISNPPAELTKITINGQSATVPAGISAAAAVLLSNPDYTRINPVSGAKRAPLCLMGVCYECLMQIDDKPQQRACCVIVSDGMQIITGKTTSE